MLGDIGIQMVSGFRYLYDVEKLLKDNPARLPY